MIIHKNEKQFFVVNGDENDKVCLSVDGMNVDYAPRYLYLGAWFTDSAKMDDVMALHETGGQATVSKFSIFCAANTQMPFI